MHKEGARGLAVFGYEPESDALSRPRPPLDGYRCSLTPADCAAMGNPFAKAGRGAGNPHVTKGSTEVRLLEKLLGEWGLLGHLGCERRQRCAPRPADLRAVAAQRTLLGWL